MMEKFIRKRFSLIIKLSESYKINLLLLNVVTIYYIAKKKKMLNLFLVGESNQIKIISEYRTFSKSTNT